jgi:hypothetical protein
MMLLNIRLNFQGLWRMGTIGTICCETFSASLPSYAPHQTDG